LYCIEKELDKLVKMQRETQRRYCVVSNLLERAKAYQGEMVYVAAGRG